jgi:hypothetical protein
MARDTFWNNREQAQKLIDEANTLRKRIDTLVDTLRELRQADQRRISDWLKEVERGQMTAEEAARMIREINGEP